MSISETSDLSIDLAEAARQLAQAAHDAQVACDSISLGDLDWAHTNAIIARAEADAAENILRVALSAHEDCAVAAVDGGVAVTTVNDVRCVHGPSGDRGSRCGPSG
jgi:hypothetical protein